MRPAAVGFQCPACVAEGNKGVRTPRTVFGGPLSQVPRACQAVLAINVVVFVIQQLNSTVTDRFALIPPYVAVQSEWYRLLTSAFLHEGVLHIAFNMYLLWLVGTELERVLGSLRFVVLYLVAGLGGAAASYAFSPLNVAALGASGAVFGLFGAYVVIARRVGADASRMWVLIGLNLVLGFTVPHIDYWAHLGGLATGAVIGVAYAHIRPGRAQLARQFGVVALVLVAIAGAVSVRTTQIRDQVPRALTEPAACVSNTCSIPWPDGS